MRKALMTFAVAAFTAFAAPAQQPAPSVGELQKRIEDLEQHLEAMTKDYQGQIQALKDQIAALQAAQARPEPPQAAESPSPPLPAAPPAANLANPAISLLPDFTYSGGNDPYWKQADALQVREVEIAFSANIDPYAKAFAALSLESGEFGVEEAYAAFPGLPGGFSMKFGKFKADFGKQNQMHTHTWFQADQPLALRTFLGDEGLSDVGVSVSHLLPTPWMSDLTVEVTGGRNEAAFGGRRSGLAYLLAWRNYWDIGDASNLEAQISLTAGKNKAGGSTALGDLSLTYRYKPPGSKRESFLWRTEVIQDNYGTPERSNYAWGGFSYLDWQFTRGWFFGARADYTQHALSPALHDWGGALALTYFPSEFQKFRLQYERIRYAGYGWRDAVVFEYGFSIGPHGAHPF